MENLNIEVGSKIELNSKECKKYLDSIEGSKLCGDDRRNLSIRSKSQNFFLRGYFDNDKVLVTMISFEKLEDGKYEWFSQFIPKSCIKKSKKQELIPIELKDEIELFEGIQNYDEYIKKSNKKLKEFDDFLCKIREADKRFSDFLEGVVIGARSVISVQEEKILRIPIDYLYITGGLVTIWDLLENKNVLNSFLKKEDDYYEKYRNYQNYILSLKTKTFLKDVFVSGTFKKNNVDSKGYDYLELVIKNKVLPE